MADVLSLAKCSEILSRHAPVQAPHVIGLFGRAGAFSSSTRAGLSK